MGDPQPDSRDVALLPVGKPVVWTVTNTGPENLIVNDGQGRRVKLREGERAVFQHREAQVNDHYTPCEARRYFRRHPAEARKGLSLATIERIEARYAQKESAP